MLIFVDKRAPEACLKQLENYGKVVQFLTQNITYSAIKGHPDIFMCPLDKYLVIAPNLPVNYKKLLDERKTEYVTGNTPVSGNYPETASYNAVVSQSYLIHNLRITGDILKDAYINKEHIQVNQGYTRCNLLPLKNDSFITSDAGIYKVLRKRGLNILPVSNHGIVLPGYPHGFFGGTTGICNNMITLSGSLKYHKDAGNIRSFTSNLGYRIIELCEGPLFDGGSIFFVD
ncbi:MAG: hypothetical protein K8R53_10630 [Bacteroidales bacterium]|nr:hypothetical protein [Bacteroidales bacterium]